MDTPPAVVVPEKNVHIGRGKAALTMKTDKLMTPKTADKECKALADLGITYLPVVGASKEVEKNQTTQELQRKLDLQHFDFLLNDEEIKHCFKWVPIGHIFTAEQTKQLYEWAKHGKWEADPFISVNEEDLLPNLCLSNNEPSGSDFEEPLMIEEGFYETDESDFEISVPGRHSSVYTPEELDDRLGVRDLCVEDFYPLPELE
ncbi:uncharacterized protein LOC110038287 [Phalaenopsis equestris]|uniref:uncharacterized protein LOC110038287 n=1 Tax=Phalaenopsis equestris TaxID=78828 RepID=UPI0009E20C96|nr:uncharacterized protein LOC110038287 [Phalaenopsis equestris]XP_020598737.1 uncharacterized protein LOC110038287 [Phalaenopsis equestris]